MTKDKSKPDQSPPEPEAKRPRLSYTGSSDGFVPVKGFEPAEVKPGSRITPQSDDHAAALLATGHFRAPESKETE